MQAEYTSGTVHVCLIQCYKSDILCVGNCSSFHVQNAAQTAVLLDHLGDAEL